MFSAVNSPAPRVLFGMVGFVSCLLAGVLRAVLSYSGPWCVKPGQQRAMAGCLACCSILLGQQKGGSFEPPIVGWVCSVVGHLNPTKSCAINLIANA